MKLYLKGKGERFKAIIQFICIKLRNLSLRVASACFHAEGFSLGRGDRLKGISESLVPLSVGIIAKYFGDIFLPILRT